MQYKRKYLLKVAKKVLNNQKITPSELSTLQSFEYKQQDSKFIETLKKCAFPLAIFTGFLFVTFAVYFDSMVAQMPAWTNMSPELLSGVDYIWDIIGEPIGKENIVYHLPNVVMYTFGFFGVKKIIESVEKRTWLQSVLAAQETINKKISTGTVDLDMKEHHSILFVGKGDFVGEQFVLDHPHNETVTVSERKPSYTDTWICYDLCTLYDDLKIVLSLADAKYAGEYLFFPVQDNQLFLPSATAFDLSPHKLDILIQNIRLIEKEEGWVENSIIIVGDAHHHSLVQTVNNKKVLPESEEVISLSSVAKKHSNTILIDPSQLVIRKIIEIAAGRTIAFRATKEGVAEYRDRFYAKLTEAGYKSRDKDAVLTVGYDIFEDLTEQQALARNKDYLPVILSKQVKDAVIRNGYSNDEFIYVPELVLQELKKVTADTV